PPLTVACPGTSNAGCRSNSPVEPRTPSGSASSTRSNGCGATMSDDSLTPRLSRFLAHTGVEDLPDEILGRTRYLLLDGIACGLVGAHLPWSRRAVEGTLLVDRGSGATLWGWDRQVSPLGAALLNGTFVQGFELDDFHPHG